MAPDDSGLHSGRTGLVNYTWPGRARWGRQLGPEWSGVAAEPRTTIPWEREWDVAHLQAAPPSFAPPKLCPPLPSGVARSEEEII